MISPVKEENGGGLIKGGPRCNDRSCERTDEHYFADRANMAESVMKCTQIA